MDTRGPGLFWIIPFVESVVKVDVRVLTDAVEQQETMTKDNVPIKVNAVIWYRVVKPDLAIIDLKMPRKDGLALLREIAARKDSNFPAVVLTSSRAGADAYRAKKRGAAEFLTKPAGVEKLHKALNDVIARL